MIQVAAVGGLWTVPRGLRERAYFAANADNVMTYLEKCSAAIAAMLQGGCAMLPEFGFEMFADGGGI